ncbi:hypothetical protein PSTT_10409, partial [Puccinia striiformis]
MPALPSDYSIFSTKDQSSRLIPPAYYFDPEQPSSLSNENLSHVVSLDTEPPRLLLDQNFFQRQAAAVLKQPESLRLSQGSNSIADCDSDPAPYEDQVTWRSRLGVENHSLPSPDQNNQEDFYHDLDHLGILDYLRSDQEFQTGVDSAQLGLDWLELRTDDRQKPESPTRPSLDRSAANRIFALHQAAHEDQNHIPLSCSSCGVTKPQSELSRLWPCSHPHCNTCINTLVNASCNDPPPPQMVCFFCSQQVDGFDPPSAFLSGQSSHFDYFPSTRLSLKDHQKSFKAGSDGFDSVDYTSPPSDQSGFYTGSFSSLWSPSPNNECDKPAHSMMGDSIPLHGAPGDSCAWPIVRVDNISWSLTVADIMSWLPGGAECLPPAELCPLPIHILCTPTDGKTLNHCFIETRNLTAAHFIVRHRHGTKIGIRPCSVVLTSSAELHAKILGIKGQRKFARYDENSQVNTETLRASLRSNLPERPFFHLMSLLSHCGHISEGGTRAEDASDLEAVEKWTNIHLIATESLFGWKIQNSDALNILHLMVDTAISSPLIDKPTLFRFLSQVGVFL